jgi:hypothetical protein
MIAPPAVAEVITALVAQRNVIEAVLDGLRIAFDLDEIPNATAVVHGPAATIPLEQSAGPAAKNGRKPKTVRDFRADVKPADTPAASTCREDLISLLRTKPFTSGELIAALPTYGAQNIYGNLSAMRKEGCVETRLLDGEPEKKNVWIGGAV